MAYSSCNEMTKPKYCYQFGKHEYTAVKSGFRKHRMLKTEI